MEAPITIIKNKNTIQKPTIIALTVENNSSEIPMKDVDRYEEQSSKHPLPITPHSSLGCPSPSLCAARFQRQNIDQYVPQRCLACGLTNKELHQQLKDIHDPSDPINAVFKDLDSFKINNSK